MTETPPVGVAADMREALRALARKDVFAEPKTTRGRSGSDYLLFAGEKTEASQALLMIPAGLVAQMGRRRWLQRDAKGCVRIGSGGVRALRRMTGMPAPVDTPRPAKDRSADVAVHETPLAWLRRHKDKSGRPLITQPQYDAGERLAEDYQRARIMRRTTMDWSGAPSARRGRRAAPGAGIDPGDVEVEARERVNRALDAVGAELAGILIDVCCHETGLEVTEEAEGWPQRTGKVVLQLALTALARHYGLIAPERPASTRLRHWGDEDYKPSIEGWQ